MTKLTEEIEDKIKQIEAASSSLSANCAELETLLGQAESAGESQGWVSGIRTRLDAAKKKLTLRKLLEARRARDSKPSNGSPSKPRTPKG